MKLNEWIKLAIWIVVFEVIGFILGTMTQANLHPWYDGLNKSALTPPGFVFSIVWTLLYAVLAMVGSALWKNRGRFKSQYLLPLFFLQLVMNWAWTPLFFQLHFLGLSFIWLIGMVCLNAGVIVSAKNESKVIALALIPYFIWLIFATYLNGVIWFLN